MVKTIWFAMSVAGGTSRRRSYHSQSSIGACRGVRDYLEGLLRYLESFHERTQPLGALEKVYAKLGDFDALWEAGQVPGWADRGQGSSGEDSSAAIDVAAFASVEELETLGTAAIPFLLPAAWLSPRVASCWAETSVSKSGSPHKLQVRV